MALDANAMAALVVSKVAQVEASYQNGEKSPDDALKAFCEAIIEHITAASEVKIPSGSSSGVYKVE